MTSRRGDQLTAVVGAAAAAAAAALWQGSGEGVLEAAVFGAALGAWRAHPRITGAVVATALVLAAADGTMPGGDPSVTYLIVAAHAISAGRWSSGWWGVGSLLLLCAAGELSVVLANDDVPPFIVIPAIGWVGGRALRERELVATQLAERARELSEEREAYAALSVRYERARIASELHDIVAHAISVMVVQASAGQRLAARDPELTTQTFEAIAGAARQAEQDMGRLVALLGDEEAIAPAPDLGLVEELVRRASGSGLDVTLRLEGEREGLPADVVEAAYRVVQEGLTNALRYAAGSAVRVLVRGEAGALVAEVRNGPASADVALAGIGTGNGLAGLRARAGELGGSITAGPTADGGWVLSARLPFRAPSPVRVIAADEVHPAE